MQQVPLVVYASLFAQACGALVLALLLLGFHRTYGREYLRHWAWSWWARCFHLLGSAGSLFLLGQPPQVPGRLLTSAVTLVAGYWEVAWLLFGTYEVTTGGTLRREVRRGVLLSLLGLALVSVVATLPPVTPEARFFGRLGLRSLLAAVAFLLAGGAVLRRRLPASAGRRLVGIAFLLYGLRLLEYVTTTVLTSLGIDLSYDAFLGLIDLLLQSLIGLGLVIWLLEEERMRQEQATERLEHLAYHDPLTDLPNRNRFVETLREAIAGAAAGRGPAVAYLDLDRFKLINESFGHAAGDRLLVNAADRLRRSLQPTHTVARLIGDDCAAARWRCTAPRPTAGTSTSSTHRAWTAAAASSSRSRPSCGGRSSATSWSSSSSPSSTRRRGASRRSRRWCAGATPSAASSCPPISSGSPTPPAFPRRSTAGC